MTRYCKLPKCDPVAKHPDCNHVTAAGMVKTLKTGYNHHLFSTIVTLVAKRRTLVVKEPILV